MASQYLPVEAWHLIRRMALRHPPKLVGAVAGFFFLYALMARLRSGRLVDSILLSVITTSILVFVAACAYIIFTHPGFRIF